MTAIQDYVQARVRLFHKIYDVDEAEQQLLTEIAYREGITVGLRLAEMVDEIPQTGGKEDGNN